MQPKQLKEFPSNPLKHYSAVRTLEHPHSYMLLWDEDDEVNSKTHQQYKRIKTSDEPYIQWNNSRGYNTYFHYYIEQKTNFSFQKCKDWSKPENTTRAKICEGASDARAKPFYFIFILTFRHRSFDYFQKHVHNHLIQVPKSGPPKIAQNQTASIHIYILQ